MKVAFSPLLINFFLPMFACFISSWHQGLGLNKLIPHFPCVSMTLSWQLGVWSISIQEQSKQEEIPIEPYLCSPIWLPESQATGVQGCCLQETGQPQSLAPVFGLVPRGRQLWSFSEIPVSLPCVRVSLSGFHCNAITGQCCPGPEPNPPSSQIKLSYLVNSVLIVY